MSTTVDDPNLAHRRTWDLIPWLVNDSATPAERALVDVHLAECVDCRDELAFQSLLHAGMAIDPIVPNAADGAFGRLMQDIEHESRASMAAAPSVDPSAIARDLPLRTQRVVRRRGARRRLSRLLVAVLALQSVGLVLLGALLLVRPGGLPAPTALAGNYQTLSNTPASAPDAAIRFVPSPSLSVGAMQAILAGAQLRIIAGSADHAIYALALDDAVPGAERDDATARAIARLRATPGVLLAEPIAPVTSQ